MAVIPSGTSVVPGGGSSPSFAADADIDFTTAGSGKVLSATPSNGKPYSFVTPAAGGGGGSTTLAAETDIDFTTQGAGKVLSATPSNGKPYSFITPPTSGGSGSTTLAADTDVVFTNLMDGQVMKYRASDAKWVNVNVPSVTPSGSSVTLSGIQDETGNDIILDETGAPIEQETLPATGASLGAMYFTISTAKFSVWGGSSLGWISQP